MRRARAAPRAGWLGPGDLLRAAALRRDSLVEALCYDDAAGPQGRALYRIEAIAADPVEEGHLYLADGLGYEDDAYAWWAHRTYGVP